MKRKLIKCITVCIALIISGLITFTFCNTHVYAEDKYPTSINLYLDTESFTLLEYVDFVDIKDYVLEHPTPPYFMAYLRINYSDGSFEQYNYDNEKEDWYSGFNNEKIPYEVKMRWSFANDHYVLKLSLKDYPDCSDEGFTGVIDRIDSINIGDYDGDEPVIDLEENTAGRMVRDGSNAYYYYDISPDDIFMKNKSSIEPISSYWISYECSFIQMVRREVYEDKYNLQDYNSEFVAIYNGKPLPDEVSEQFALDWVSTAQSDYDHRLKAGENKVQCCLRIGDHEYTGKSETGMYDGEDTVTVNVAASTNSRISDNILYKTSKGGNYAVVDDALVDGEVILPGEISIDGKSYGTYAINDNAFTKSTDLTSIELPNTLEIIGEDAFCETNLKEIVVPASVTSIGTHAIGFDRYEDNPYGYEKIPGFVIIGEQDSAAERYAVENGISFKVNELTIAKEKTIAELDAIDLTQYSGAERDAVEKAITDAKAAVKDAKTIDAVNNALKEAKGKIEAQKTNKQKADEAATAAAAAAETTRQGVYNAKLPKVTASKPKASKKAVTVKWKKLNKKNQKKAQKIEVWVCPNKAFGAENTIIKTVGKKKTSAKVKGLNAKTKYFVKVRSIKYVGGVKQVGKWSKVKTIKVR